MKVDDFIDDIGDFIIFKSGIVTVLRASSLSRSEDPK